MASKELGVDLVTCDNEHANHLKIHILAAVAEADEGDQRTAEGRAGAARGRNSDRLDPAIGRAVRIVASPD